jgi:multimeric flavodoxin WrbA
MKLVVVNGSPHGTAGGTGAVAEWVLAPCREAGADIRIFDLAGLDLRQCNGCGRCMNAGDCVISDDTASIHTAWEAADAVLFVCPTHVFHITGLMKTFIDRCAGQFHRPPLIGKYSLAVSSSAGMGETEALRYMKNCLQVLGAAYVGEVWGIFRPPTNLWEPELVELTARRLGQDLMAAVAEKRVFQEPDEVISQRRFLKELIYRNRKIFKADFDWWRERGWL